MSNEKNNAAVTEVEINQLRAELQKAQYRLQCINDVVRDIASLLDLDQILQVVAEKARELIGAEKMMVPIIDADRKVYTYLAASGKDANVIHGQSFSINIGMCGWVLSNKAPLFFGENSHQLMGRDIRWKPGMESALLVPLMSRGNIVGGLSGMGKQGGGSFTREDQALLEMFAGHISIAIENAMIFKELKQQQFQLQSILSYTPSVIYIKDTTGKYLLINHRFEEIFDITNDAIIGKTDYDIFPVEFAEKFTKVDKNVLLNKKPVELEETAPHAEGVHTYLTVKFPLFDTNNNVSALCGISTDITEIRKVEDTLRRAQKMEAIGQLTGGIAHDFNNQLGVVLGYLDVIRELAGNQPNIVKMLDTASSAGLRCTDLTRQLLAFSRKQSTDNSPLSLCDSLGDIKELLARSITPQVAIEYDLPADLWQVQCNKGEFQDAILNMVINARDAMPDGGKLKIALCNIDMDAAQAKQVQNISAGEYVRLTISDTGIGMNKADADRIFEPFFTTKPVGKGTGLGMAMVYGFVGRAKGAINVYSEQGMGTRISIYFPRVSAGELPLKSTGIESEAIGGNELVLVVDDDEDLRELTVLYLKKLGYRIVQASNANMALDIVKNNPEIKLLLSDVAMPGMNGFQLADKVLQLRPAIIVLMVTGYVADQIQDELFQKYTSRILYKPYRKDVLGKMVREMIDGDDHHAH